MIPVHPLVKLVNAPFGLEPLHRRFRHDELAIWQTDHSATPGEFVIGLRCRLSGREGNPGEFHVRSIGEPDLRSSRITLHPTVLHVCQRAPRSAHSKAPARSRWLLP